MMFHNTFSVMEEEGMLDVLNVVDVLCLHVVFIPRIQSTLNSEYTEFVHCALECHSRIT